MVDTVTGASGAANAAAGQAGQSAGRTQLNQDFDDFLQLLVTQLQNQDPLEPTKSEEFTNQLVSFSQLEQQISQNEKMDRLIEGFSGAQMRNALNYIGRTVIYAGDRLTMAEPGEGASFNYELTADAEESRLSITDANGNVVYSADGATGAGTHNFAWDGTDDQGNVLPAGSYRIHVGAQDGDGEAVPVNTYVAGVVSAVEKQDGLFMLMINGNLLPETEIRAVS